MALASPQTPIKWLSTLQKSQSTLPLRPKNRDPIPPPTTASLFRTSLEKALKEKKRAETLHGKVNAAALNHDYAKGAHAKIARLQKELRECKRSEGKVREEVDPEFRDETYFLEMFLRVRRLVREWVEGLDFDVFYDEGANVEDYRFDFLEVVCGDYLRFAGDKLGVVQMLQAYFWKVAMEQFKVENSMETHNLDLEHPSTTRKQKEMYNTCRYLGCRLREPTLRVELMQQIDQMIPFIYRDLEPILQQLPDPLELTRLLGALGIFMILIDKQKVVMFLESLDKEEYGRKVFSGSSMEDIGLGGNLNVGGAGNLSVNERVVSLMVTPVFGSTGGEDFNEHQLIVKAQVRTEVKKEEIETEAVEEGSEEGDTDAEEEEGEAETEEEKKQKKKDKSKQRKKDRKEVCLRHLARLAEINKILDIEQATAAAPQNQTPQTLPQKPRRRVHFPDETNTTPRSPLSPASAEKKRQEYRDKMKDERERALLILEVQTPLEWYHLQDYGAGIIEEEIIYRPEMLTTDGLFQDLWKSDRFSTDFNGPLGKGWNV